MSETCLDTLLDKLCDGNDAAAEEVFRAYEPLLRRVVRRQLPANLQSKFDSVDIVQSVWADVLQGFRRGGWKFHDAEHLRAFLVRVVRNRFIDRYRTHRRAVECEQPLTSSGVEELPAGQSPRPSQLAQASELWEQLLEMCPPEHRQVLQLKRQGLALAEIAARTGLHDGSIRRIIRNLARRLAFAPNPRAPLADETLLDLDASHAIRPATDRVP